MSRNIDYEDYIKAWETMKKLFVNISHETPKDDPDLQKFIDAYRIIKAYEAKTE